MSASIEDITARVSQLEDATLALKQEKGWQLESLLEGMGEQAKDIVKKIAELDEISEEMKGKYDQATRESKLTEEIARQYCEALENEIQVIKDIFRSPQEFLAKQQLQEQEETAKKLQQLQQIRAQRQMAKSQSNVAEAIAVTASSSAVEAPSQPAEEPNDATSAPMKKTIEELEAEIDILEKEIKRMFKLYNPTSTDLLKYSGLSRTSTEQKNIITKRKEKNEDFYEPALAYKEALKAQLEEIKSKVISPIVQEFKPLEKSENAFIKDVKSIAAGIGRSIGRSPVGQFFKWVGEGFQSGLNALFGSKLSEKTADQPLSNASEAVELVEMQLAEQLSATSNAIQQIHQTRPTIPLNEAPNDNATLFSKALSPSEELQVGKEAVAQQKLELDKLQRESGNLDSTIFLGNTEALKEMLHQTYELKEDADFRKLWKESGAKEKAYNDLIKSNDPKDLQKIYAAGLEYEKALKAQIAKKHEYLAPEKPGYKSPR